MESPRMRGKSYVIFEAPAMTPSFSGMMNPLSWLMVPLYIIVTYLGWYAARDGYRRVPDIDRAVDRVKIWYLVAEVALAAASGTVLFLVGSIPLISYRGTLILVVGVICTFTYHGAYVTKLIRARVSNPQRIFVGVSPTSPSAAQTTRSGSPCSRLTRIVSVLTSKSIRSRLEDKRPRFHL